MKITTLPYHMKIPIITIALVTLVAAYSYSQTNTFPASGNVGIGTNTFPNGGNPELNIKAVNSANAAGIGLQSFDGSSSLYLRSGTGSDGQIIAFRNSLLLGSTTGLGTSGFVERARFNADGTVNFTGGLTGTSATFRNYAEQLRLYYDAIQFTSLSTASNGDGRMYSWNGSAYRPFYINYDSTTPTGQVTYFGGPLTGTTATFRSSSEQIRSYYDAVKFTSLSTKNNGDAQIYSWDGAAYKNILLAVDGNASGGNVGIGTIAPEHLLDVVKQGAVISRVYNSSSTADARVRTQNGAGLMEMGIDATGGYLQAYNNIPIVYHIGGSERMRLTTDGNVAIGTTNPQNYKLAVAGKIRATEIKVEALPWPDYVFSSSYNLPDLKDTEQFIKDHKHLPEIPSAAEVAIDGINLGEMNAKLLQKIEELTLHLIDQNKRIGELEKQLKSK